MTRHQIVPLLAAVALATAACQPIAAGPVLSPTPPPAVPITPSPTQAFALAPTPSPVTTSPALTPAAVWPDRLARIRDFLNERRRTGASLEAMASRLDEGGDSFARMPALAVSPPAVAGAVPAILVAASAPLGYAIFWWEGEQLRFQDFPVCAEDVACEDDPATFAPNGFFVAGREQLRDGKAELGVVYDFPATATQQAYRLLRLEGGRWVTLWDGRNHARKQWRFAHARVSFAPAPDPSGDALATITLRSSSMGDPDGKGLFFQESNPGPHRYFQDTWQRKGDRYELARTHVEPSAYAALVEFLYRLSKSDESGAATLVAAPGLVARAKALGLNRAPSKPSWSIDLKSPEVEQRGPITIVEGPPVTVSFVEREGQWLIADIAPRSSADH